MPDIWSKVDDVIYEYRWVLALLLVALTLIGGGLTLLTNNNLGSQKLGIKSDKNTTSNIPDLAETTTPLGPVNINTASQSELESLPGIGPVIAGRIIDYRTKNGPFKNKGDLKNVKGIGEKTFADLKDKITLE